MKEQDGRRRLLERFAGIPAAGRVLEAVAGGAQRSAGGLWGGSQALLLAALAERSPRPMLVITADGGEAGTLLDEIRTFSNSAWTHLPAHELDVDGLPEPLGAARRLRALADIADTARGGRPHRVVADLEALLQPAPRPRALRGSVRRVRVGQRLDPHTLLDEFVAAGLRRVPVVLAPGEASLRGDVLDVFGAAADEAIRIEVFDDVVESLRVFDPETQKSLEVREAVELALGAPPAADAEGSVLEHLLRPDLLVVLHEPLRLEERGSALALRGAEAREALATLRDATSRLARLEISSLPSHDLDFRVLSAGSAVGSGEADPVGRLRAVRGLEGEVLIVCRTEEERARLAGIFARKQIALQDEQVTLVVGALARGFRLPDLRTTVISNVEFAGRPAPVRVSRRRNVPAKALRSFFELGPGDLVVHAVHGIAVFEGIELVKRGAAAEDCLRLRFRDDVHLLVPASKVHLVQKYVGAGDARPPLDKLGGKGFARRKEEVQRALFDMAADLLEVQARRRTLRRPPCPEDPLEQDMLDGFPFTDTEDQATAWREIRADLESEHPMDRLLCGDVGFGKTELAMRAAFRVAIHGRQVAVLVPTTVLAEQHGRTFSQRFGPLGLRVEVLSRFSRAKERTRLLADLERGLVDVVIGTHRLLSKDVRFRDLGLLIVDEEQRFGVRDKEHLKRLRLSVDVLSLSATPIPRTLHASLLGLRDISTLSAPPPGRQDVETHVAYDDPQLLREALHRELAREGQAFVVHNRIETLEAVARRIGELAPGARIALGHGRMTSAEMERTMRRFVRGEADVLVCTTIIENGLDLPRANTILIDRAERFGLAELHQLRGRVGRSSRKAWCYLLLDRAHPPGREALQRLKALEEFSQLGAGFAISMKDLEIRGAGNLLGPEQSGHIAAVGYDMYTRLLRAAVESAKSDAVVRVTVQEVDVDMQVEAYLPADFVQDPKVRLETLREMDEAVDVPSMEAVAASLEDRFGKLPRPARNLLSIFLLKHLLLEHGVLGAQFVGDRVVVRHPPGRPLGGAWLDAFADVRAVEAGKTHLLLPPAPAGGAARSWSGEAVLEHLLSALLGRPHPAMIPPPWRPARRPRDARPRSRR